MEVFLSSISFGFDDFYLTIVALASFEQPRTNGEPSSLSGPSNGNKGYQQPYESRSFV
jgi:hypothetical protein